MYYIRKIRKNESFREIETKDLYNKINKNIAYTHSGFFHADDVLCTALLRIINPNIKIKRVHTITEDMESFLVFDIGGGKFDHHQSDNESRTWKKGELNIPYASFGKLWELIGYQLLGDNYYKVMDYDFVSEIDRADNSSYNTTFSMLIESMNPQWNEDQSDEAIYKKFEEAVSISIVLLNSYMNKMKSFLEADRKLEECLSDVETIEVKYKNKNYSLHVLYRDEYIPIIRQLSFTDVDFYIYPSNRGGYCISPIKDKSTKDFKIKIPEWLYGKNEEELSKIVNGIKFVHSSGFLATSKDKESAYRFVKYCTEKSLSEESIHHTNYVFY